MSIKCDPEIIHVNYMALIQDLILVTSYSTSEHYLTSAFFPCWDHKHQQKQLRFPTAINKEEKDD